MAYKFKECYGNDGLIIEADVLPTENIDKTVLYLVNGKYYKWFYSSSYELLNELKHLENPYGYHDTVVNCFGYVYNEETNQNDEFSRIRIWEGSNGLAYSFDIERSGWHAVLYLNGQYPYAYRHQVITFTEPITDEAFIAWLGENARHTYTEQGWLEYNNVTGADALPSQVVEGSKFVGANGSVEEGTLPYYDGGELDGFVGDGDGTYALIRSQIHYPSIVESEVRSIVPLADFGNAQPSDVRAGVIFTSAAGVAKEGTLPTVGVPKPTMVATAYADDNEIGIRATNTQGQGYVVGGSMYNETYVSLTVDGNKVTMKCGDAKIERSVGASGASIATCTVNVTFSTNVGNCLISATTFDGTTFSVFNSAAKSGTVTIPNVVCGSALSINTTSMCSLYWSGSQTQHNSLCGGTITVPNTAGTYTVEVGVLDD